MYAESRTMARWSLEIQDLMCYFGFPKLMGCFSCDTSARCDSLTTVLHSPALLIILLLLCPWERKPWLGARCFLHFSCPVFPLKSNAPHSCCTICFSKN